MRELRRALAAGWVLFSRSAQGRLAYTQYFFLDMGAVLISSALALMLWIYVDDHRAGGLAMGRGALIAYLALALAVNFTLSLWVEGVLGSRIRSGQVAVDLLKPLNFQWLYFAMSVADVAIQICMAAGVLLIAFLILPVHPLDLAPAQLGVFAVSLGLALLTQYALCFLFTLGAFFTNFGYGIFNTRLMTHAAFSGVFAPLALYPETLRRVALALPFHCIVQTPVLIGMGWVPADRALPLLLQQLAWALGLLAVGQLGFRFIVGRLSIQGG